MSPLTDEYSKDLNLGKGLYDGASCLKKLYEVIQREWFIHRANMIIVNTVS